MTRPWEIAPTGPAADAVARIAAAVPVIETERLRLRAPRIGDFGAYAEIVLSDRWKDESDGTRKDAWLDFCQMVAGWLLRGTGIMAVERREDCQFLGFTVLNHEYGDPELELGWFLNAEAEGHGYATEAAGAYRGHAARTLGLTGLVSYIAPDNARSARVAERLGAARDAAAEAAYPDDILVYRHPGEGRA
ncbi:MAG: GNAT family N-acetyltransferase [Paracoccaceae bacterium]